MCKYCCSLYKDLIGVLLYHKYNTFSYNKKIFTRFFHKFFHFSRAENFTIFVYRSVVWHDRKVAKIVRIFRCDFVITKSVPGIQTHSIFFPCVRRSRGPMGPPHGGPKTRSGTGAQPPKNRNFPLLQKVCLALSLNEI